MAQSGVDALAISIGNAHGLYPRLPQLDFGRLGKIAARVDVPLVLHGGSGTPSRDLHRTIGLGIAKVNVASELGQTFREALMQQWSNDGASVWISLALAEAMPAIGEVVKRWLHWTGAAGKA